MAILTRAAARALLRKTRSPALGLDVSPSRVGLAVSGPGGGALPLGTIKRAARDVRAVSGKIAAAATRHRAALLAVGWPLEPSGVAGERCAAVRAFVDAVRAEAALPPVVFVDERFTTQAARHALVAAEVLDKRELRVPQHRSFQLSQKTSDLAQHESPVKTPRDGLAHVLEIPVVVAPLGLVALHFFRRPT